MRIFNIKKTDGRLYVNVFGYTILYHRDGDREKYTRFLCFKRRSIKKNNKIKKEEIRKEKFKKASNKIVSKKPAVSVIVPVFNAANYIDECLSSLIHQNNKNIEIILVNDASTDDSLKKCECVAKKDSRIRLINVKNNIGVAAARNLGLSIAVGEYIGFVDPDDFVDLNYFGHLYRKARIYGADIVMTSSIDKISPDGENKGKKFSGISVIGENLRQRDRMRIALTTGITWNKIYKREFVLKNLILFPEIKTMGTDNYFTFISLMLADKVLVTDQSKYYYRTNPESIIRKKKDESYFKLVDVYERILTRLRNISLNDNSLNEWARVLRYRAIKDFVSNLNGFDGDLKGKFIEYAKLHFDVDLSFEAKPIISLTSYPARIRYVSSTIESLKNQRMEVKKIILWLSKDQFINEKLPTNLTKLEDNLFEIRWLIGDLRSYKKLVPAIDAFPDDLIITADDDVIYPEDWVERLMISYLQEPTCIHALRGRQIKINDRHLMPYKNWNLIKQPLFPEYSILPTGVGGCLYKKDFLFHEVSNAKLFVDLAKDADDVWFWCMALKHGTKIKIANPPLNCPRTIDGTQETALWNVNASKNDKTVATVLRHYPEVFEKLF